jgi:uncharacterized protein YdhG (YjbR/CyaY superfamily)
MPDDVEGYIAAAAHAAQPMLRAMREAVRAAAPLADERLSCGMPSYSHQGRVAYFAAFKGHIGLYGFRREDLAEHGLEAYAAGRGSLRFPLGQPLPVERIRSLIAARVAANEAAVSRRPGPAL